MLLTHPDAVRRYVGEISFGSFYNAASVASSWIEQRVPLNGHVPLPVREAAALLTAVFYDDPDAMADEALIPNMVRLMILPWVECSADAHLDIP